MNKIENTDYSKMLLELSGAVAHVIVDLFHLRPGDNDYEKDELRQLVNKQLIGKRMFHVHRPTEEDIDVVLQSFYEAGLIGETTMNGDFISWDLSPLTYTMPSYVK